MYVMSQNTGKGLRVGSFRMSFRVSYDGESNPIGVGRVLIYEVNKSLEGAVPRT